MYLAISLLMAIYGLLAMLNPRVMWDLTHMFTVVGGEPTEFYLKFQRVIGAVCLVAGVIFTVVLLFP